MAKKKKAAKRQVKKAVSKKKAAKKVAKKKAAKKATKKSTKKSTKKKAKKAVTVAEHTIEGRGSFSVTVLNGKIITASGNGKVKKIDIDPKRPVKITVSH